MVEGYKPIRVLLVKPGLDGHDRGIHVLALALRDAGMEVIYTGLRQTVEAIVQTAIHEDVDVVGLSNLTGSYMIHFPRVAKRLKEEGMSHVLVVGGGIIPEEDIPMLKQQGINEIFGPGSSVDKIADYIRRSVELRRQGSQ